MKTELQETHKLSADSFPENAEASLHLPEAQEILDWDTGIRQPPPRPAGILRAKMKYGGRSKPMVAYDPSKEQ